MERFSWGDAAELAGDVGPDQRLLGVLVDLEDNLDVEELRDDVRRLLPRHPTLSRTVVRHGRRPWRATWRAALPDLTVHVARRRVADPVQAAVDLLVTGLPESIPMWRLWVLDSPHGCHLVFVVHHVLLDGAGAARVIADLAGLTAPTPSNGVRARHPALSVLGLLAGLGPAASATSLLTPITSGFRLRSVDADLAAVRSAARRAGATVNDALLLAVGDALRGVAAARGERLPRLRVSVPVASPPARGERPGRNQVGAFVASVPERRPGEGDTRHLARIAAGTRARKMLARAGGGPPPLSAVLAVLGALGWYRPLFTRQRAITTLVTNLRGPSEPVTLRGVRVRRVTPLTPAIGNVTVVVAAASYAGRLRVTLRMDRSTWPEEELLVAGLRDSLRRLAGERADTGGASERPVRRAGTHRPG